MTIKTGAKKHTHKYEFRRGKYLQVWTCANPDCSHYMPKHLADIQMEGRKSICWDCGSEFVLDSESLKMDRPVCIQCANPELVSAISEKLKDFGL
jgi:formylmethanofuran dehydrogenase subunit E